MIPARITQIDAMGKTAVRCRLRFLYIIYIEFYHTLRGLFPSKQTILAHRDYNYTSYQSFLTTKVRLPRMKILKFSQKILCAKSESLLSTKDWYITICQLSVFLKLKKTRYANRSIITNPFDALPIWNDIRFRSSKEKWDQIIPWIP